MCGRKITIGVSQRVEELSDRPGGYVRENAKRFESLVPLPEVIGASIGTSAASKKAEREYRRILSELGSEFEILRNLPLEEIRRVSGTRVAEGIGRLRSGQVERIPGFDGEYGVIRLFSAEELNNTEGQMNFFDLLGASQPGGPAAGGEHGAGKIAYSLALQAYARAGGAGHGAHSAGGGTVGHICRGDLALALDEHSADLRPAGGEVLRYLALRGGGIAGKEATAAGPRGRGHRFLARD